MVGPVSANTQNVVGDRNSPGGFDYNRISGVEGNRHVTPEFIGQVEAMAQRLGTQPEYLMAVMSFETGGSFSPGVRNGAGSGATGLIQFMPNTARELGTSTDALARMSATEQLQYVERYFNNRSDPGELNTLEGVYTTVLYGSPRPDPGATLFSDGTAAYRMNSPLDTNRDGRITAGEATSFVRARIDGDAPPPRDTGPAPAPGGEAPAPAPSPSGPGGSVTVRSGDTLSGIATRNGVSLDAVIAANPQIRNPGLIYPGQTVHLPGGGGGGGEVTVRNGDTLTGIAARNGVSLDAVLAANPQIRDPDLIHPGQLVRIPGGGASAPGGGADAPTPQAPPTGNVPTYAPYTVYSTGNAPAIAVQGPGQMQPHHDYQTAQRGGQTLEVRDLVLHRNGQSQTQQAIPSPIAGTVVSAGPMGNAGNAVVVRGDEGQLVYIFHMSSVDVRAGQQVAYGQDLGNQGATGNSTGPHVHIEASSATIDRWVNDLLDGRFDGRRQ
ncbi:LysM peptidoglycan-binding domain-containing protein [Luteimonas sp. MC1572]|uniref:LysM peptidoglycan-binding domain-containing protein n=1 Tax=Luteimonas sp. MC1572 TaxID=2799325 RepID=UPI0018F0AD76|nr:LysM peptidoglycan-binding domain-containing protein [Luteimonas sp. MC1572]MBJ6981807.1 LysM peptidoglycan-binding domain-containing protein [Luteimonas sp. MC1572]QQO03090.1 LysM peptidoglycan-binding domain-containing protein [Luteimonas sp. MC1572]